MRTMAPALMAALFLACNPAMRSDEPPTGSNERPDVSRVTPADHAENPTGGLRSDPSGALPGPGIPTAGPAGIAPAGGDSSASTARAEPVMAVLQGVKGAERVRGTVHLTPAATGVAIDADVQGLQDGRYSWTVHANGDCSDPAGGSVGPELDFAAMNATHGTYASREGMVHDGAAPSGPGDSAVGKAAHGGTNGTGPAGKAGTPLGDGQKTAAGSTATPTGGVPQDSNHVPGHLGTLEARSGNSARGEGVVENMGAASLASLVGHAIVLRAPVPPGGVHTVGDVVACGVITPATNDTRTGALPATDAGTVAQGDVTRR